MVQQENEHQPGRFEGAGIKRKIIGWVVLLAMFVAGFISAKFI